MLQELIIKTDADVKKHFELHDNLSGEFLLSYGQIEMLWGQEGEVIEGIEFCPFCGIKFIIDRRTD